MLKLCHQRNGVFFAAVLGDKLLQINQSFRMLPFASLNERSKHKVTESSLSIVQVTNRRPSTQWALGTAKKQIIHVRNTGITREIGCSLMRSAISEKIC